MSPTPPGGVKQTVLEKSKNENSDNGKFPAWVVVNPPEALQGPV